MRIKSVLDVASEMLGIAFVACFVTFISYFVLTRLVFHPLAKFPGPKIAALTRWYELYYDGIHKGKYLFKIEEMHKKYGQWAQTCN